jgi:hypothetical protein
MAKDLQTQASITIAAPTGNVWEAQSIIAGSGRVEPLKTKVWCSRRTFRACW